MNKLEQACNVAIAHQAKVYGAQSERTKITNIAETEDLYIFDFYLDHVVYGGGGLLVSKKDLSVDNYCLPSYPTNIIDIIYHSSVNVEIPKQFQS